MIEHGFVQTNGIRMHYAAMGQGPLVVLLHGFPEFWYSWRHQLPALAQAGFRAVAPDLRGWGETDKPKGIANYRVAELLKDIDGLRAALGYERAHLVGHDWGGGLAWWYATAYADRVERLAVLNCPHPAAMFQVARTHPTQVLRSWYIGFFQIPWLPEALSRLGGYYPIRRALTSTANPQVMSQADLAMYMANVRQPGALTAGMNYYRALVRLGPGLHLDWKAPVKAPTLLVWGERDPYLIKAGAEASMRWTEHGELRCIPQASHWVQLDASDLVNGYLTEFLGQDPN